MIAGIVLAAAAGTYICTSLLLLRFPTLIHKKKKPNFRCRHISHRGGAGENLENTLTAFKHAVDCGTEMIELDVQLTADKQVVVCHDNNLSRIAGVDMNISDLNYEDLPLISESLEVTFSNRHIFTATCEDRKIPLLRNVFEEFKDIPINLDVKSHNEELIDKVYQLICEFDRKHLIVWGNFLAQTTDYLHKLDPEIPVMFSFRRVIILLITFYTGLLPFLPLKEQFFEVLMPGILFKYIAEFYWPMHRKHFHHENRLMMSSILIRHLERRGIQTYLWVINEDEDFDRAFDKLAATGVMTDYPSKLSQYLKRGNFVIAVNGDEKVDLENAQLYQKASRWSLTYSNTNCFLSGLKQRIVKRIGQKTYLWVINEEEDFDRALNKLCCAGVMTDYPSKLSQYLNKKNS